MKYLPLYKQWMIDGCLPHDGLCHCLPGDNYLSLFEPPGMTGGYWGYYGEFFDKPVYTQDVDEYESLYKRLQYDFNPLRQTIVLFMAAMNNEL